MADSAQFDQGVTGSQAPEGTSQPGPEEGQQDGQDEPRKYAGKFDSVEDLEQSYQELQRKLGENGGQDQSSDQSQGEAESQDSSGSDSQSGLKIDQEASGESPAEADVRPELNSYVGEYIEKGELSEESLEQLKSQYGFDEKQAREVMEGQKALHGQSLNEVYELAGGSEEDFQQLAQWAAQNLSQQEIDTFNEAIESGWNNAKMAVENLRNKYNSAKGTEPSLYGGNGTSETSDVYTAQQQMVNDMNSEKYKTDPEFRDYVRNKLARSQIGG